MPFQARSQIFKYRYTQWYRDELIIPEDLQIATTTKHMLIWDSDAKDTNKSYNSWNKGKCKFLQKYENWFEDGIFKVAPELFTQIFTLQ